jgi:hypothetical protein
MIEHIDKVLKEEGYDPKRQEKLKGLTDKLDDMSMPDTNKKGMLRELNFGYNQYAGTVDPETVRKRRAKNKRSKQVRRRNRK